MIPPRLALIAFLVFYAVTNSEVLADEQEEVSINDYNVSVSIEVDRNKAREAGISLGAFFRATTAFLEKHEQFDLADLENLVIEDNSRFREVARIRVALSRSQKKPKETKEESKPTR